MSLLVAVIPGLVFGLLAGAGAYSLALAPALTLGIVGFAAWAYGELPYRYNQNSVAVAVILAWLLALMWRWAAAGIRKQVRLRQGTYLSWRERLQPEVLKQQLAAGGQRLVSQGSKLPLQLLGAGGILGGMWLWYTSSRKVLDPTSIDQVWDVQWHANVLQFISDTGIAAPQQMGQLLNVETASAMYYPTAWHALAWLLGQQAGWSTLETVNYASIMLPALAVPLGAGTLAWQLTRRPLAGAFAALLAGAIVPYSWVLYYVGAWPYLVALTLAPAVVAAALQLRTNRGLILPVALATVGLLETHPAAATMLLLVVLDWFCRRFRGTLNYLACGALVAVGFLPQFLAGKSVASEVAAVTATSEQPLSPAAAIYRAAIFQTAHNTQQLPVWFFLLALAGGVVLLFKKQVAPLLTYGLAVLTCADALTPLRGNWHWVQAIGNLHYNTPHRLVLPVVLYTVVAVAALGAEVVALVALRPVKSLAGVTAVVEVVAGCGTCLAGAALLRPQYVQAASWAVLAERTNRLVDGNDQAAMAWLARQPEAQTGRIMVNPAEGSGWMYALYGLNSVFTHYLWPDAGPETQTGKVYWHADQLGTGVSGNPEQQNEVDLAAQKLNIKFIYVSPPQYWAWQEPHEVFEKRLWETPGVTPVYLDGHVSIFAVNQALTDGQLLRLRASSPEPLPPLGVIKRDHLQPNFFAHP